MGDLATDISVEEVIGAYHSCRRQKRSAWTAVEFEADFARNIMDIYHLVRARKWAPSGHMCFVVMNPSPREVWASNFADRVVHHLAYNRLRPRFEPHWIGTSFACITGRGTSGAASWAERSSRRVTQGFSRPAFILQMDVRSFFPSIRRDRLCSLLLEKADEPWLQHLITEVINVDVRKGAHFPGNAALLKLIPGHKTLWSAPEGLGLPIGNLTSQFGANVYLDAMDQRMVRSKVARHYGRYVDDILVMDASIEKLREAYQVVVEELSGIGLTLHPQKTRCAPASDGFDFCGRFIKPWRTYLRKRTARKGHESIKGLAHNPHKAETVTSYLAMARQCSGYRLRRSWAKNAVKFGVKCDQQLTKSRVQQ